MKKKILRLLGTISAFFISIFGLVGCDNGRAQVMYGVPPDIQQDLYGVPAPTQKYDPNEDPSDIQMSETADLSDEF